ncbi:ankyrin repeat domain-containing protein [Flavobacterium silvaticum]|uniref:Ankyrin repeat domain-containing protein n=1 Tax=Flavobacterium silvaticum TaxID=1852020 RepID=A0A972JJL4_9FLAO|nr:ankyrin repeat domain-containing protein [Flavobacterium silvaticum]NMH28227.1 ankyrin repeat domain-containing protein [Flavobacterium silvaticum]
MIRKTLICLLVASLPVLGIAQKNVFLDRAYWKTKPNVATIEAEIKKGNNPSELDKNAFDATVFAILEDAPKETIEFLLSQKGNDVNKITHDGRTYIFWAAYKGNADLMRDLIKRNAKTDIIEDHGYTIMNFAAATGQMNTQVYDICLEQGADLKKDVDHDGANALLLSATYSTDFKLLDYFSKKGLDIDGTDSNGNSAFNYAAKTGNVAFLGALIKKGVPFNNNAFLFAATGTRGTSNKPETYQFLESLKLKPSVIGKNGENALHILAKKEGQLDIIKWFLDRDAKADQMDKDGNTPLLFAASSGEIPVITLFAEKTGNVNLGNKKKVMPVALAIKNNSAEAVELLLSKGAKPNVMDSDGNNLVAYLIQSYDAKKSDVFDAKWKLLEKAGVNLTANQQDGNTLYHLAVSKNDLDLLKRLSKYKIDVNAKNKEGYTALHKAAMIAKDDTVLKYLISIGAKKDITTDMKETAFSLASENEFLSKNNISVQFLKS